MKNSNDIKPGQKWVIDRFQPEDAVGVTELFRTVYGEGYPVDTFINPGKLLEENHAQRTISSVARTDSGDIVGHNALFRSAPDKRIYESGAGLVHPLYRGGAGIFTGAVSHGVEIARQAGSGVEAIFGEPVCNHVFSQKLCYGQGWITQAAEIALMPAAAYTKEASAKGRVTALLDFMTIKPRPHEVFIPQGHEDMLGFLYEGLDDERTLVNDNGAPPEAESATLKPQFFEFAQVVRIAVPELGRDIIKRLAKIDSDTRMKNNLVTQIWLPSSQTGLGWAVAKLEEMGFFPGGILPRWFGKDGLLMQRVKCDPGWGEMQIHFERAEKLMAMVREKWSRAAG